MYTCRTCPVQSFGRARTNPGRVTGRDLVILFHAGVEWGVLRDGGGLVVVRGHPPIYDLYRQPATFGGKAQIPGTILTFRAERRY